MTGWARTAPVRPEMLSWMDAGRRPRGDRPVDSTGRPDSQSEFLLLLYPFTEGTIGGPSHKEKITYVIDAGEYVYTFSHLHFPHDKAMSVTVNSVVKFAIEKKQGLYSG